VKDKEMPFLEHLAELRKRLILCISVLFIITVVVFPVSPNVLNLIIHGLINSDVEVIVLSPQEAIIVYLNISILLGIMLSFPVFAYHLWAFMAPGLIERERKLFLYILISSLILFISGTLFSYFILLPLMLRFLIGISYVVATPLLDLRQTSSFVLGFMILFGLVFQLPLMAWVLTRIGILNTEALSGNRRYVILTAFIIGAITTDPSVVTQILVAIPIIILYEISIIATKIAK